MSGNHNMYCSANQPGTATLLRNAVKTVRDDESLLRQALTHFENARDYIWKAAKTYEPWPEDEQLKEMEATIAALRERLGESK